MGPIFTFFHLSLLILMLKIKEAQIQKLDFFVQTSIGTKSRLNVLSKGVEFLERFRPFFPMIQSFLELRFCYMQKIKFLVKKWLPYHFFASNFSKDPRRSSQVRQIGIPERLKQIQYPFCRLRSNRLVSLRELKKSFLQSQGNAIFEML